MRRGWPSRRWRNRCCSCHRILVGVSTVGPFPQKCGRRGRRTRRRSRSRSTHRGGAKNGQHRDYSRRSEIARSGLRIDAT
jgi:hypothetical protein